MHDRVQLAWDKNEIGYIVLDKFKLLVAAKMCQVLDPAGYKVVHTDNLVPLLDQPVTQMRTQETCRASDEYPHGIPSKTKI